MRIRFINWSGQETVATIEPVAEFRKNFWCQACGREIAAGTSGWRTANDGRLHAECVENARTVGTGLLDVAPTRKE